MKITREIIINGESQRVDYELTGIELERCYNEYVNREEKNAIVNRLEEDEYEGIMDIPDDLIQRMAEKYHKFLDEYSADVKSAAMNDVLEKFGTELEPYKEKMKVFEYEITRTQTITVTIAAKNEDDSDAYLDRMLDNGDLDNDFGYAEAEYDRGYAEERNFENPEYADYNAEEE